jgi:hypothetical protein
MADNHYSFDRTGGKAAGWRLGRAVEALDNASKWLVDERDAMIQMRDGDGSQDTHYASVTTAYGFSNDAEAHSAFLELDSLLAKINVDASVSSVKAAIGQFIARFRN